MLELPDSWVWDFWVVRDGPEYHLFFLFASRALRDPDARHLRAGVGHAVSTDLRSWRRVQDALVHSDPPAFDQTAIWTGSTVRGPQGWVMAYTGTTARPDGALVQQIGLAHSVDLFTWTRRPGGPVVTADPRWYETAGIPEPGADHWRDEHWRDPWLLPDPAGDGWHMLLTARARTGPPDERGVIGHATSPDLESWTVHPPLTEPGHGFGQLEVPQVETVLGHPVLVFNCLGAELGGRRRREWEGGGVWVAPAAGPLGPYDLAAAYRLTDERLYVGKLVQEPDGAWVLLAFVNDEGGGRFGGRITDPTPVVVRDGRLALAERPTG
ncbi:glycosyl hydrolase family 32 [Salana multivorans]